MRYPFAPIDKSLAGRDVARALQLNGTNLASYRANGLSTVQADKLAIRLGRHPSAFWPSWAEDAELEGRCPWCGEWRFEGAYCTRQEREFHRYEQQRHRSRAVRWWKRLDRYRETGVLCAESEEAA